MAVLNALLALGGDARRAIVIEQALADGGFTPDELSIPSTKGAGEKYASLVDYYLAWTLNNLKKEGLVEKPEWGVWRLTDAARLPAEPAVNHPVSRERLSELSGMPYWRYLRTPEWRRTRAIALFRAGYACSLDVTHTSDLDVHHRTYERRGAELPSDLVVLCRSCHLLHHRENGRPRRESR